MLRLNRRRRSASRRYSKERTDLPVKQPTTIFEPALNRTTAAKPLGIGIPKTLLTAGDDVVDEGSSTTTYRTFGRMAALRQERSFNI
jgi:hypothetical protein